LRRAMKKTTVCIDEMLLEKAVKVTGVSSKKEAIEKGLSLLIQMHNIEALRRELGTFEIDLSIDQLAQLRNDQ